MSNKGIPNGGPSPMPKEKSIEKTLVQQADEFQFMKYLQTGSYLDVKDTTSSWCLAQVVKMTTDQICVHYDGWSEKYDEIFSIYSSRIAPLRRYSRGYTGQKSMALRYTIPTIKDIQESISIVTKLTESNFAANSAHEFTQFIRGTLFVQIDFLMTNWPVKKDPTILKSELEGIITLSGVVLKMICKWLLIYPQYYTYYLEAVQNPQIFLISLNHAIAVALPELCDMLKLLFGLIPRCEKTFATISKELTDKQNANPKSPVKTPAQVVSFQKQNIAIFQQNKGFELVAALVKNNEQPYPNNLLMDLLEPLAGALRTMKDDFAKQYSNDVLKEITDRFATLSDREIKEMTKSILDKLCYLLESVRLDKDPNSPGGRESVLTVIFSIAIQLIKSSYIQKKLLGLSIIKDMIPKYKERGAVSQLGNLEWRDPKMLIKVMEDFKLVDIILGENAHAEILRKVEDIFIFLIINEKFEAKYIEMLWKCSNEKHEEIMRISLSLLSNLVCKMSYPLIQELFKHIESTPCDSEILLKFLENYTVNVIQACNERDKKGIPNAKKSGFKLYNLDIFWNLLLDSSQVPGKLKDQAMEALILILNKNSNMANDYVIKAAECIKNEQIVIRGVQLLRDIDFAEYYIMKDNRKEQFYKLGDMNLKYSITTNTLKDCENYHQRVIKEIMSSSENKKQVMDLNFGTGFTFAKQAKLYIDFFEYYCQKGNLTLSKEDFLKLWKIYIENSLCEAHADILFTAMMREQKSTYGDLKFILFNEKVAKSVFEELLCSTSGTLKLTPCGFQCFKTFMNWLNRPSQVSAVKSGKNILDNYQGLSTLWDISFQSEVNIIKEQSRDFLVYLIEKLCQQNRVKRKEITEKALETALDKVKDTGNAIQTRTALLILNSIIEKIECLKYEEIGSSYYYPPLTTFQCFPVSGGKPVVVQISENLKLSNLKCMLSNVLKVHKSKIVLKGFHNKTEYSDDCDYFLTTFKRLTDNKFYLDYKKSDIPYKETPRFILANSAIFARLQEFLKSPKEDIVNEVWKLVLTLPLNEEYKDKLKKMTTATIDNTENSKKLAEWERCLDLTSGYDSVSLVYYLYVLNELIGDKENTERKLYTEKFLKKSGPLLLFSIFHKKKNAIRNKMNLKCIQYCLRIISTYISSENYSLLFAENLENDVNFWNDILELIEWVSLRGSTKNNEIIDEYCEDLLNSCCQVHYSMLKASSKLISNAMNKNYISIFKECILRNRSENVQKNSCKLFKQLILEILIKNADTKKLRNELINILLLDFLKSAQEEGFGAQSYFELMSEIIEKIEELDYEILLKEQHIQYLVNIILTRKVMEKNINDIDYCLGGFMGILRLEIMKSAQLKNEIKNPLELAKGILESLFNIDQANSKCKNEKTRSKALLLLETIIELYPGVDKLVRDYLNALHIEGNWRTNKKADWNIRPGLGNRAGNFCGLKNLGATCYMNSSLQQLFMIPQFRKGIIEAEHKKIGDESNTLFQLQLIFASLLESQRAVYNPKEFTQTIKMDGRVLNVIEQKDVDEFLTHLLDQLETELKPTPYAKLIKNTFKLTFANEIIGKECRHHSETHEEAISVIISVKNKKHIYEGLKAYIQADTLEGDNAYFCEKCDKKVSAYKRQNIKTLPNVLLIVLKRFEFNVETMAKVKVNDFCEFPHELDLEEFTQEGQTSRELNKDLESGKISLEDLTEDQRKFLQRKIPKFYYQYKLKGIIVHSGHVDSGHYYSYIMNRENNEVPEEKRWLEFNDAIVREFDPNDIPDETFGGEEENYYSTTWNKKDSTREKIRNAYVLIYERIVPLDAEALCKYKEEEREIDPIEVPSRFEKMRNDTPKNEHTIIPGALQKIIHQDNKKFWMTQYIFHPNYLSFVSNMINKCKVIEDNNYVDGREHLKLNNISDSAQFATIFLLTTAFRAENKDLVPELLKTIKAWCNKNIKLCLWLARLFMNSEIIQEFIIDCPHDNVRRWVAGLLYCMMKQLYPLEKSAIGKIVSKPAILIMANSLAKELELPETSLIVNNKIIIKDEKHKVPFLMILINSLVQQYNNLYEHNCGQYFQILAYFARLGPEARKYLNCCWMFGFAFETLTGTKGKCQAYLEKNCAYIELKSDTPVLGNFTREHVYISQKARAMKKPLQHLFIFELMYRLIQSGEIVKIKKLPMKEDIPFNTKFCEVEENYISTMKDPKGIENLLACCGESKVSLTYYCKMLAYLALDNSDYTNAVFSHSLMKLASVECINLRPYCRMIFFILLNADKFYTKPQAFIKNFADYFKKNTNIYRITECYIDFLIKLCRENMIFLSSLRKDTQPETVQCLNFIEKWLAEYPYPSYTFYGSIFKTKMYSKASMSLSENLEKRYRPLTEYRKACIKTIRKAGAKLENEDNSDDDLYTTETKFKEKSQCDVLLLSQYQWVTANIIQITDEVLKVEYMDGEEKQEEWIEMESDRLMPAGSMVKNLRWQLAAEIDSNLYSTTTGV